jgi:hypothetical protein
MSNYFGIKTGEGRLSELYIGNKGGTQASFVTASAVDGKADLGNINMLTASHARITTLDVVTINSIQTTQEELNISASLIVASDGAAASDEADGSGLFISGANASFTWNDSKSAMVVNKALSGSSTIQGAGITGTSLALQSGGITAAGSIAGVSTLTATGLIKTDGSLEIGDGGTIGTDSTSDFLTLDDTGSEAVTVKTGFSLDIDGHNGSDKGLKLNGTLVTATAAELNVLDGVTAGTVAASKGVVVDSSKDATGFRSVTGSGDVAFANLHASSNVYTAGSLVIGSTDLNETDLAKIDGITNGTVAASKAVVVDASKDANGFRSVTGSGDAKFANLHATAGMFAAGAMSAGGNITGGGDLTIAGAASGVTTLTMSGLLSSSAGMMVRGDAAFAGDIALSGALTASALQMNSDGSSIGYNGGNVELDVAGGTVMTLTSTNMEVGVKISGSAGAHIDGAATFGSTLAATGSITAGTSFIIGSADINETDLEKIDGITDGTGAANKALVLDANADVTAGLRSVTGSGDAKFANFHASSNVYAGGSLVVGSTDLSETDLAKIDGITNGAGAANKALVLDGNADVASGLRSVTGSGDVAFANLHASSNIYATGDITGSAISGEAAVFTSLDLQSGGITNAGSIAGITALSASQRVYSNSSIVSNGTLGVSGSATFDGAAAFNAGATATTLSASSTLQAVGATTLGSTLEVSGAATFDGAVTLGNSGGADAITVHGDLTVSAGTTANINAQTTFGDQVTFDDHATLNNGNHLKVQSNDQCDLGESGTAFRAGYITTLNSTTVNATNVITGDFHMKNERGDWTLFEESDHIRIRNNATGQVFRMGMTLIEE